MVEKTTAALSTLFLATGMLKKHQLEEASKTATNLSVPIERALTMLDMLSNESITLAKDAEELVENGTISLDMAVRAVRLARQQNMLLEDAIGVIGSVHKQTAKVQTITTPLTSLLIECGLIATDAAAKAAIQARDTGMQPGRILVLNREVSSWAMNAALSGLVLVKEKKIEKEHAIEGIKAIGHRRISIEQSLFELGLYVGKGEQSLKIGELIPMAGLLSEGDLLECIEIELVKEKQLGQVLLEQGFITNEVLESAVVLTDMIASRNIKGYQAAEALRKVFDKGISVYHAMGELDPPVQAPQKEITFGDLLVEAGLASAETVEGCLPDKSMSTIKSGKKVLSAGIINESMLYLALRSYSLYNQTLLSADNAAGALRICSEKGIGLDEALSKMGWLLPARMQWIWT